MDYQDQAWALATCILKDDQEVAGMLELSLSQVKVYLHRARKELREQLTEVRP